MTGYGNWHNWSANTDPQVQEAASPQVLRRRQLGMTLVELLIGMALGLVVAGGALALFLTELQTRSK